MRKRLNKIKEFIERYYWIAGILLLIAAIIFYVQYEADINKNKAVAYGEVYDSSFFYGQYSKRNYQYQFYYKGEKYTGSSTAFDSQNVEIGNFYKVEFSDQNPKQSRMLFNVAYVQELKTDQNGRVVDTLYIPKTEKIKQQRNEQLKQLQTRLDSIKNAPQQ